MEVNQSPEAALTDLPLLCVVYNVQCTDVLLTHWLATIIVISILHIIYMRLKYILVILKFTILGRGGMFAKIGKGIC